MLICTTGVGNPSGGDLMTRHNSKECPYCYSEIDVRATVCPVCRRDIDELIPDVRQTSPSKKRKGCLVQWKYTPVAIIILLFACGLMYLLNSGDDSVGNDTPARSLPPTYTPRDRSFEASLQDEINSELADYDYDTERVLVKRVEIRGTELVVHLEQRGQSSLADNWGQLGIVHGVIARNEPDVTTVRTIYIIDQDGFIVRMDDLLDHYNGRMEFEDFRKLWTWFEP